MMVWEDFVTVEYPDPEWIVDGLVPRQGITLLWGKESIGKTPICWYLAKAAAAGEGFFGMAVPRKRRTLFLELDMQEQHVHQRVKKIQMPGVYFSFHTPLVSVTEFTVEKLKEVWAAEVALDPEFVVVDSLRAAHPLSDIESTAPKAVYTVYRHLFPNAGILYIHHERKTALKDDRPDHESFSGSKAWANDCDHRLHVHRTHGQFPLRLDVVRSKVGETDWHMKFHLHAGYLLTSPGEQIDEVRELLAQGADIKGVMAKLGCSRATAYRRIQLAKGEALGL